MALDRKAAAERTEQLIAAAQATLAAEVEALVSGEDWRRYLTFASKLHHYSARNVMLIVAQHRKAFEEGRVATPIPACVAGYKTWQSLGRQVMKGQRGYVIIAPIRSEQRVAIGPDGTARRLRARERPESGEQLEVRHHLGGFRAAYVFDVAQTTGEDLPEPPAARLLEGTAPAGLREAVTQLLEARGYRVRAAPDAAALGGANGMTKGLEKVVLVRADLDDAAQVKTLLHEAAHVLLHMDGLGHALPRPVQEVEAESVAYVVATANGLDTAGYSFPYVASWAGGDKAVEAVLATQDRVATAARVIIAATPAAGTPGGTSAEPGSGFAPLLAPRAPEGPSRTDRLEATF